MTEEVIVSGVPEQVTAPIVPAAEPEKMLSQSEVNKLVAGIKKESFDKGHQAAVEAQKASQPAAKTPEPVNNQDIIKQAVKDVISEQNAEGETLKQQKALEAQFHELGKQLAPKIAEAKSKHADFDSSLAESGVADMHAVILLSNYADNAGDVLYELSKSPAKLGTLTALMSSGNDKAIKKYVTDFSATIKAANAVPAKTANKPLGNIKPSVVEADNGSSTLQDFKRKFRA